ncbi:hypothetical protein [Nonomuraea basaltis]|uniref:hypothetical protein n=1 Tax=Nonomuraea basaltis TaxID=2495887 RepID=UPI00110C425F|nr:hypothetical protein [Nonomuraea basaltis]TMR92350.1 hypothetical protein EJK15_45170 [Nonomuraea basaltis]
MKLTRWLSRASATTAILTVIATGLVSPASAAAPPPWAADLPDLSTPQIAYNRAAAPVVTGVAARGADGALLYSPRSGNGLGPLQSLGGMIIGDPSVVVTVNGTHFFVRGTDDQVYTNTITPSGAVTGYSVVPGLTVTGEIESISPLLEPAGSIGIFARGPDGAVWNNILRNGVWTGWSSLGGFATSEITAARTFVVPQSTIRVFVRGSDHRIYVNAVTPTGASGFQPLGGLRATSNIAVADDTIFPGNQVFVRGEDNAVWYYNLVSASDLRRGVNNPRWRSPSLARRPRSR